MTLTYLNKIEKPYNEKFLKMTTNIEVTEAKKDIGFRDNTS